MVGVVYGFPHYKSILGILKICEIITCILAISLVAAKVLGTFDLINAFYAGTIIGIIVSTIIFAISSTESGHSLNGVLKFQCFAHAFLFIYLLITCSIFLARTRYWGSVIQAGGAFGLIASFLYLIDALLTLKAYGWNISCRM